MRSRQGHVTWRSSECGYKSWKGCLHGSFGVHQKRIRVADLSSATPPVGGVCSVSYPRSISERAFNIGSAL
jgi:hypothetical protein